MEITQPQKFDILQQMSIQLSLVDFFLNSPSRSNLYPFFDMEIIFISFSIKH